MYAIIEDGAHQYKVEVGQIIDVQRKEVEPNATVAFDKVLLVSDDANRTVGQPYIADASVTGTALAEVKGDKIDILKYRRRKDSKVRKGHRQRYSRVRIDSINA